MTEEDMDKIAEHVVRKLEADRREEQQKRTERMLVNLSEESVKEELAARFDAYRQEKIRGYVNSPLYRNESPTDSEPVEQEGYWVKWCADIEPHISWISIAVLALVLVVSIAGLIIAC